MEKEKPFVLPVHLSPSHPWFLVLDASVELVARFRGTTERHMNRLVDAINGRRTPAVATVYRRTATDGAALFWLTYETKGLASITVEVDSCTDEEMTYILELLNPRGVGEPQFGQWVEVGGRGRPLRDGVYALRSRLLDGSGDYRGSQGFRVRLWGRWGVYCKTDREARENLLLVVNGKVPLGVYSDPPPDWQLCLMASRDSLCPPAVEGKPMEYTLRVSDGIVTGFLAPHPPANPIEPIDGPAPPILPILEKLLALREHAAALDQGLGAILGTQDERENISYFLPYTFGPSLTDLPELLLSFISEIDKCTRG